MYNFVTSGIATEISLYKLAVTVDQNHVSIQKADTYLLHGAESFLRS